MRPIADIQYVELHYWALGSGRSRLSVIFSTLFYHLCILAALSSHSTHEAHDIGKFGMKPAICVSKHFCLEKKKTLALKPIPFLTEQWELWSMLGRAEVSSFLPQQKFCLTLVS